MRQIPLTSPDIHDVDIEAVTAVLRTGMLVQGINVNNLEQSIAAFINAEHVHAVANGTATMHLALTALGIGKGDEVIVPAFSYVATANVVELVGATPIFVDIDLATFNIDVTKIESAITPNTKAIIPVHEFGLACDIEYVMQIANKYGLAVIEDAACALGAKQNDKFVGTFGTFGSFSLHPRKAISSGEGGLLVSGTSDLAKEIGILRNHGIDYIDGKMEFVAAGFNYRLTDFQAALVNSQLKRLANTIEYKRELAEVYFQELKSSIITLPFVPEDRPHTWQTFHVLVANTYNRDELIADLKKKGIGTNYGAQCIPAQKYYLNKYKLNSKELFPNALIAFNQGLALPIYEKLKGEDIQYISSVLNNLT